MALLGVSLFFIYFFCFVFFAPGHLPQCHLGCASPCRRRSSQPSAKRRIASRGGRPAVPPRLRATHVLLGSRHCQAGRLPPAPGASVSDTPRSSKEMKKDGCRGMSPGYTSAKHQQAPHAQQRGVWFAATRSRGASGLPLSPSCATAVVPTTAFLLVLRGLGSTLLPHTNESATRAMT
jgi:hypothetical protein